MAFTSFVRVMYVVTVGVLLGGAIGGGSGWLYNISQLTPNVRLVAPTSGTEVSQAKGFTAEGTVSGLGNDTIWLTDYNHGYTVDDEAIVNSNGTWSASDSDLGKPGEVLPFSLAVRVILADTQCAATLQATSSTNSDYLTSLPGGCTVVGEVIVRVTKP